jgi:tetratricopeptide (TPR) repeat protein
MSLHRLQVAQGAEKAARLDLQFEATRSQTIADFLVQVLLTSTPEQQGASTTVVEALRRAPQMLAELKGDSQTVYDLRQSIGRMLFAHGDYGPAEESFRVARSMAAKLYGSGSKEHRDCGFLSARACMESGNYGRSEALLEEVLDHAQQEPFWPQSGDLEMLRSLAHLYAVQDDHEKAREIGGQAVDLARRKFGPDSVEVARGEQVWGAALYHLGEREVGSQIMRRSFQSLREGLGLRHPEAEAAAQNLWFLELREREVQPADELRLKEIEERYGDLHPFLGEVLQMLGDLAWANERVEDAHHYFQRCVDLRRDKLGEEHLRTAQAKHRLSQVFFSRGDFDRVIELLGEALGVFRHEIPESWETGVVLTKIGEVYYHSSRYAEAEPYFREALGFGRDRKRVGYLANCRFTQRFWDQETVSLMVEADRLWGDTDRRYNLIRTLQRVGDFAEVRKWSRRTIEERRHVQGVGDFKWYRYEVMAALEVRELELAEVALEELERRVVETQESVDAEAFSRERMLARAVDGCLALAFEDPEGAVPLLRVAIEHLGEDSTYFPSSGRLLSDLGAALWELGELAEAERCLSLAGQQLSAYFGESDWLTLRNDRRWRRLQEDLRQECAAVPSK